MIFGPGSKGKLNEWRQIHARFTDQLKSNRKSGSEVLEYLKSKYILQELTEEKHLKVVSDNVLNNEFFRQKLSPNQTPCPVAFILQNEENGRVVYENQEDIWEGCPIYVGINLNLGLVHMEGSCFLYDEVYAFQGIDSYDLENGVRTADFIECIKNFNIELYHSLIEGKRRGGSRIRQNAIFQMQNQS